MSTIKKTFIITDGRDFQRGIVKIIGQSPKHLPYVAILPSDVNYSMFIQDKDLERFAVNILKSLKSKHLKNGK